MERINETGLVWQFNRQKISECPLSGAISGLSLIDMRIRTDKLAGRFSEFDFLFDITFGSTLAWIPKGKQDEVSLLLDALVAEGTLTTRMSLGCGGGGSDSDDGSCKSVINYGYAFTPQKNTPFCEAAVVLAQKVMQKFQMADSQTPSIKGCTLLNFELQQRTWIRMANGHRMLYEDFLRNLLKRCTVAERDLRTAKSEVLSGLFV